MLVADFCRPDAKIPTLQTNWRSLHQTPDVEVPAYERSNSEANVGPSRPRRQRLAEPGAAAAFDLIGAQSLGFRANPPRPHILGCGG